GLAGTAVGRDTAVLHRIARLVGVARRAVLRRTAGAATAVAGTRAIGLVLELFDFLFEPANDLGLDLLGLRTTASHVETALDRTHQLTDAGQALVLPRLHVEIHQRRHHLVTLWCVADFIQQSGNGTGRLVLVPQGVFANRLVEVVGGRVHGLLGLGSL